MTWTAILILAGGAYLFKAVGLVVVGPLTHRRSQPQHSGQSGHSGHSEGAGTAGLAQPGAEGLLVRAGQLLPPALLAALVVSQTVVTGTELTIDARLAGVVAGGAAAIWKQAPFWLVLVIAAVVTATVRQLS
jgi:hypothetical protein